MSAPVLVWFRLDLRLADNPALHAAAAAAATGRPVLPLFLWSPEDEAPWAPGGASSWWLHHSLAALDADLRRLGSRLLLHRGPARDELPRIVRASGATSVYWNRRYEPAILARDATLKAALRADGVEVRSFNGSLLCEPWEVQTQAGAPFQVFTPFWRACTARLAVATPLPAPTDLRPPSQWPASRALDELDLLPTIDWTDGLRQAWTPGEGGAAAAVRDFCDGNVGGYRNRRDVPAERGTSRLSPHLHFGEIGPRQVWHAVTSALETDGVAGVAASAEAFLREIGWREFAYHLLYHFPFTPERALRDGFERFPWRADAESLRAWQRGRTGYPIVDAGMRELWTTGWMHNRVRMIAASFLVKDLLLPWQSGAAWFWDTLVDADLASNTLGWQWTAGCGADAAPYFRVFNPTLQSRKFDPDGRYLRRWVPELAGLSDVAIHEPWKAGSAALRSAGVQLGGDYPEPIVDHGAARTRALVAFEQTKRRSAEPQRGAAPRSCDDGG